MLSLDAPSILSVTQVSRYMKEMLNSDEILQDVWVRGEISGCKTYSSGHCYFTLKDAEAREVFNILGDTTNRGQNGSR